MASKEELDSCQSRESKCDEKPSCKHFKQNLVTSLAQKQHQSCRLDIAEIQSLNEYITLHKQYNHIRQQHKINLKRLGSLKKKQQLAKEHQFLQEIILSKLVERDNLKDLLKDEESMFIMNKKICEQQEEQIRLLNEEVALLEQINLSQKVKYKQQKDKSQDKRMEIELIEQEIRAQQQLSHRFHQQSHQLVRREQSQAEEAPIVQDLEADLVILLQFCRQIASEEESHQALIHSLHSNLESATVE